MQGGSDSERCFWGCAFGDAVYRQLVPSEHRTQLKHHVAVLGVCHTIYVKSTSDEIVYAVLISNPTADLQQHIEEVITIVAPHLYFLYQNAEHIVVQDPADGNYFHSQDRYGLIYTTKLWRAVDKHIRERCFYENGASLTPGPQAFWPKLKPFVDFMSCYLTHIESGRGSNLNVSQFVTLRFLNYLVYNAYVLHRVIAVEDIIDARQQGGNSDGRVLVAFHRD